MAFQHQDWNQVVLTKKPVVLPPVAKSASVKKFHKLDNATESEPLKKTTTEFKQSLQKARLANNMNQKVLAQKLNITVSVLQQYENGKLVPTNLFISQVEKVLNTKLPRL